MPPTAWIAIIGVMLTVLVQFAGMIWFAATMNATLKTNVQVVQTLKETVDTLHDFVNAMDRRVLLLENNSTAYGRRSTDLPHL